MKLEPKRLLVKFFKSFTTEGNIKYNWHALAFHFVRWLIVHGTRESKISGGGGCFVRFSPFTVRDMFSSRLILDIYALFWVVLDDLRVAVDVLRWL